MPMTEGAIRAVAIVLTLFVFETTAATEDQVKSEAAETVQPSESRQTPPAPSRSAAQAPASSFTPSEQIRADSSVPFPVDI